MHYRTHQGETLSAIGFGCYALSGVYGRKDPDAFVPLLRRAYELGVTFFDTADVYGPGEEVLGRAVAPFREQVWIATKAGWSPEGKPDTSAEYVSAACDRSLRRLQLDTIDLYQIHFNDPVTPVEETVEALEALQAAGKIRHYGVSHLPLPRLERYFTTGDPFSALVELSAASRSARDEVLPLCRQHNVAAIAHGVTGRGLLTGTIGPEQPFEEGDIRRLDPLFQREQFASGLRVVERFQHLAHAYGKTAVQVAIAWVLAQPGVVCALTGPSSISHLEENVGGSGWSLTPEHLAELDRFFAREDERVREEQAQSIRAILSHGLEARAGFRDLVYALETLADLGLATEEEILPLFQRLWAFRGQQDASSALDAMQAIQGELRERFLADNVAPESPRP
jgi:aryl-alcohol dehydrogenase-like predicted oxidoreductase